VREALARPRLLADNPMFTMTEQPGIGSYLMPATPLDFAGATPAGDAGAPAGRAHRPDSARILGLSEAEVGRLHDARVVAGPA
jgi:2-methylfumaryl-CoA isomerase